MPKQELAPGIRIIRPPAKKRGYQTERHRLVVGKIVENRRNGTPQPLGAVLLEAGYAPSTAIKPTDVTNSRGFQELLEAVLPDDDLTQVHKDLLQSKRLDHMTFPLGPEGEDDPNFSGADPNGSITLESQERTTLTDEEITALISDVGGTVRRIVHGLTARHVYFWAPNDKARHDALKLAYDLKGRIGNKTEPPAGGNTYNTYIQNNTLDPNAPAAKQIVQDTLQNLMNATKRKAIGGTPTSD
jgi:hypothetical protein